MIAAVGVAEPGVKLESGVKLERGVKLEPGKVFGKPGRSDDGMAAAGVKLDPGKVLGEPDHSDRIPAAADHAAAPPAAVEPGAAAVAAAARRVRHDLVADGSPAAGGAARRIKRSPGLVANRVRVRRTIEKFGPPEYFDDQTGMPVYRSTFTTINGRRVIGPGYSTYPGFYYVPPRGQQDAQLYDLRELPPNECFKCPGKRHWNSDCPRARKGAAYYKLPL
jgi:hypothetical protein